jgi:hypothetical protein
MGVFGDDENSGDDGGGADVECRKILPCPRRIFSQKYAISLPLPMNPANWEQWSPLFQPSQAEAISLSNLRQFERERVNGSVCLKDHG